MQSQPCHLEMLLSPRNTYDGDAQQNPEENSMPFYKALERSAGIFNGDGVSSDDSD